MEEREWISVEDRLPEIHTPVLCNFRHWNKNYIIKSETFFSKIFKIDKHNVSPFMWL